MHGIVILLESEKEALVRDVSAQLVARFDLHTVPTYPHCSLHVAEGYDFGRLEVTLPALAQRINPFAIQLSGLGLFPQAEHTVVYATVVRTPKLNFAHELLLHGLRDLTTDFHPLYIPTKWIPHITFGSIPNTNLPDAIAYLASLNWYWESICTELAVMQEVDGIHIKSAYAYLSK